MLKVMKSLKEVIYLYLEKYPPSLRLFRMLEKAGDIFLIGGVLREFKDNGDILNIRDIDIVIDIKINDIWQEILYEFQPDKNNFGGYKLFCSGLVVDIWPLDETWAYRAEIVKCSPKEYVENLTNTVFLNVDAIVYDFKKNVWYDEKYQEAMKCGILDIVLEHNPEIPLNIIRAMVLKKRYCMIYSPRLRNIIRKEIKFNNNFVCTLMDIQESRYKKEVLSKKEIEEELRHI